MRSRVGPYHVIWALLSQFMEVYYWLYPGEDPVVLEHAGSEIIWCLDILMEDYGYFILSSFTTRMKNFVLATIQESTVFRLTSFQKVNYCYWHNAKVAYCTGVRGAFSPSTSSGGLELYYCLGPEYHTSPFSTCIVYIRAGMPTFSVTKLLTSSSTIC